MKVTNDSTSDASPPVWKRIQPLPCDCPDASHRLSISPRRMASGVLSCDVHQPLLLRLLMFFQGLRHCIETGGQLAQFIMRFDGDSRVKPAEIGPLSLSPVP